MNDSKRRELREKTLLLIRNDANERGINLSRSMTVRDYLHYYDRSLSIPFMKEMSELILEYQDGIGKMCDEHWTLIRLYEERIKAG